jgi:hypothetical protein
MLLAVAGHGRSINDFTNPIGEQGGDRFSAQTAPAPVEMIPTVPDLRLHSLDSQFVENWAPTRKIHEAAESFMTSVSHN